MADAEHEPEGIWERGWEGHERLQRARLAALSLEEKIRWLEDAQRLVERLACEGAADRAPPRDE